MEQYGASFRQYFRQLIWATKKQSGQQFSNKSKQKTTKGQQIKEDKIL